MWKFLTSLHRRHVAEAADFLVYGFFTGVGLLLSLTVMLEIIMKSINKHEESWSALRLAGPQVWFPIDTDEDYIIAVIVFVYAIMYFRGSMLLGRAIWRKDKYLSVSWRMCECGTIICQLVIAILLRKRYGVMDFVIMGFDSVGGLLAVLYTLVAEANWPDQRTGGLQLRPLSDVLGQMSGRHSTTPPIPGRRTPVDDIRPYSGSESSVAGEHSPASGQQSPVSGRSSPLDRSMRAPNLDSSAEPATCRAVAAAMERARSGSVRITEAMIHWTKPDTDDIQLEGATTRAADLEPRAVAAAEEGAASDSEGDSTASERESGSPDGPPAQFTPSQKGKYAKGTRVKFSRAKIRTLPEIAEEGSTEDLDAIHCESESSPEAKN